MESIDIDIGYIAKWLMGPNAGLQGWITTLALVLMSLRLGKLAELAITVQNLERTVEEQTDAIIDNTEELQIKRLKGHADIRKF